MPAQLSFEQRQDLEMYASVTDGQAALLLTILDNEPIKPHPATLKSLRERELVEANAIALTEAGIALAYRARRIIEAEGKYGGKCDHAVFEAVEKLRRLASRSLGRKFGLTAEQVKIVLKIAIGPNLTWGHMLKAFDAQSLKYLLDHRWLDCSYTVQHGELHPGDTLRCTGTVLVLLKRTAEGMEVS